MRTAPVSNWRLLNTGYADGAMNMAVDEAIMRCHAAGQSPATLRFYRWQPACLSIGYAQSMAREIDVEKCRELGFDVVRRPTGGRAIFHERELTYSLVAMDGNPHVSGGIVESYRKISRGMIAGLNRLGAEAVAVDPADAQRMMRSGLRTPACFDSPSHYEVAVGERKILGSAQTRSQGTVLQHGSLLLDSDNGLFFSLLRFASDERRRFFQDDFEQHVTDLRQVLGRAVSVEEVATAIHTGFEEAFGGAFVPSTLTPDELELAGQLRREKYATEAWNFKR